MPEETAVHTVNLPLLTPPPKHVDMVNHPAHYTSGKIEVADFIEDQKLGWALGNAVKYIARAGKKDPSKEIEDLEKAGWYVARRIKQLREAKSADIFARNG